MIRVNGDMEEMGKIWMCRIVVGVVVVIVFSMYFVGMLDVM